MSDLKNILSEEYKKKNTPKFTLASLTDLIEEIMEISAPILRDEAQVETQVTEKQQDIFQGTDMSVSAEAIPAPSVSELGWASLKSNDEGTNAKRQELEQYLMRIPGANLRVKLKNISRVLKDPQYAKTLAGFGDSQGERIASTLSYLVFLKTLTTVITNFNASSAGFNFEAFLAVLLGGTQIPAAGASTIADLTSGDGTPISLKLYKEKTVKAGGSYNDLIADLTRPPYMMRYVVATKTLEGKDLERQGLINVYQYDLTSDNIVEILYSSSDGHNSDLIRLPRSVIDGSKKLTFRVPKVPTIDDVEERFYDLVKAEIGAEDWYDNLVGLINYQDNRNLFVKKKPGYQPFSAGTWYGRKGVPSKNAPLFVIISKLIQEQNLDIDGVELFNLLYRAQEAARQQYIKALRAHDKIGTGLGAYAGSRESRDFFNRLSRPQKRKALMLTLGAIRYGNQYELRRSDIYNIDRLAQPYKVYASGQKEVNIGEIEIGQENIQDVFTALVDDVNRIVFEIFQELSALSADLQSYFSGGLADTSKANSAIVSAANIGKKTEETKDIE